MICLGLSRGFHDAGVAETKWAVEFDEVAAKAFQKNFRDAIVYQTDCNELLKALLEVSTKILTIFLIFIFYIFLGSIFYLVQCCLLMLIIFMIFLGTRIF